jgi:hypothetical protein
MEARKPAMSAKQYVSALAKLGKAGLTPYAAAPVLGISVRQSLRYAADGRVPATVAKLVRMFERFGIPADL